MNVQFSTSNKDVAKERMVSALKDYAKYADEFIAYTCDLVEKGLVRIGDPAMYGDARAFPMEHMTPEQLEDYKIQYDKFIKAIP